MALPLVLDDPARRLMNHLVGAVQRSLRMCNAVAVEFPPTVDALVLAALVREQSDVPVVLLHVRAATDSPSTVRAAARHLGLPLVERIATREDISGPEGPFGFLVREARLHAPRLIMSGGAAAAFGTGAIEDRPTPSEAEIAETARLQLRFPFLDRGVVPYVRRTGGDHLAHGSGSALEALARQLGLPALSPGPRSVSERS